jgi:hypothetical protein
MQRQKEEDSGSNIISNNTTPNWAAAIADVAKKALRGTRFTGVIRITVREEDYTLFFDSGRRRGELNQILNGDGLRRMLDSHPATGRNLLISYDKDKDILFLSMKVTDAIRFECAGSKEAVKVFKPLNEALIKHRGVCDDRDMARDKISLVTKNKTFKRVLREVTV